MCTLVPLQGLGIISLDLKGVCHAVDGHNIARMVFSEDLLKASSARRYHPKALGWSPCNCKTVAVLWTVLRVRSSLSMGLLDAVKPYGTTPKPWNNLLAAEKR